MKRFILFLASCFLLLSVQGQEADYGKMSSHVRRLLRTEQRRQQAAHPSAVKRSPQSVCAFVKTKGSAQDVLAAHGATLIDSIGQIAIADIPLVRLAALSKDERVVRIEAKERAQLSMDQTPAILQADAVYAGTGLPQAYTGKGVVVGVQDVGFDVTHPTYFDTSTGAYRVKALWDQLAPKEEGSSLYVGRELTDEAALLSYGHTTDGLIQTHGTHTSGTAAGSGGTTAYRGIAFESDIALVGNAVNTNISLVPEEDREKYTYTTDILGFKYLFDYATAAGKPCVVSFSEGSLMDFRGDDQLYFESLAQLVGPGKILVASAGNSGWDWMMHKNASDEAVQAQFSTHESRGYFTLRTSAPITVEIFSTDATITPISFTSDEVLAATEQTLQKTLTVGEVEYAVEISAYANCYNAEETILDIDINGPAALTTAAQMYFKLSGTAAAADLYAVVGNIYQSSDGSTLLASTVFSPGAAPDVICVGATAYRTNYTNEDGQTIDNNHGSEGALAAFSGRGPTFDGRTKPDVVAPGVNIAASLSKAFYDNCTDPNELKLILQHDASGYPWGVNTGTSMSTPVVAGVIALWLEADPTLSPEQIRQIFSRTCSQRDAKLSYPNNQWGYGEINAYKGLLDILNLTDIEGLSQEQPSALIIRPTRDGEIEINTKEAASGPMEVKIFSLDGRQIYGQRINTLPATISPATFNNHCSSVVAVQVNGPTRATSGSTLIRLK